MNRNTTVLFVVPRSSKAWQGSEAMWITIAGWASAAEKKFGKAYVLTIDRLASPAEVYGYPRNQSAKLNQQTTSSKWRSLVPNWIKTMIKDGVYWKSLQNKNSYNYPYPWKSEDLVMVWEHHDIFSGIGSRLAHEANVPFIKYVHAPQVWEAKKWGVARPFWGRFLERFTEFTSLSKAELVLCVSEEVRLKLLKMGIDSHRILVSPMAVDPFFFENNKISTCLDLPHPTGRIKIGWIGSFRKFHGLDTVIRAIHILKSKGILLEMWFIGDGLEKDPIRKLSLSLGLSEFVLFLGRQKFLEIPFLIKQFDLALVSADSKNSFHYSPLKLREYLICGIATIAPRAGEIPLKFKEGKDLLLYEPGDSRDLADKIEHLIKNEQLRNHIAASGQALAKAQCTWEKELNELSKNLKIDIY